MGEDFSGDGFMDVLFGGCGFCEIGDGFGVSITGGDGFMEVGSHAWMRHAQWA